jgi:polyferredoxin/Pyruvate/2-oxoacid:ferredoxin oxidoreductase delta subunit
MIQKLRKISQLLFLAIFFFLFFNTKYTGVDDLPLKAAVFLDIDPLIHFAVFLSQRNISALFSISLLIIMITLVLGRLFCGWACPFGTIHDLCSKIFPKTRVKTNSRYRWKYYLLIFLLVASLFTLDLIGIFDPISLLVRSLSVSISPLFDYIVRSTADSIYSTQINFIVRISEWIYGLLKQYVLNFEQQYFLHSIPILAIFITIIILNKVSGRFWCKDLCPLGAFLGIFARFGLLNRNIDDSCTSCKKCLAKCKMDYCEDENDWRKSECLMCFNCTQACPSHSIEFTMSKPLKAAKSLDLERRRVISSGVYGILLLGGLRLNLLDTRIKRGAIRPPGSLPEKDFLQKCVKCSECMRVCLRNVISPAFMETGLEGLWTPILDFNHGYCEYYCTLCGQVCPSGAIEKLDVGKKTTTVIGLAYIDKARCVPYREAKNCIVCEEFCPTAPKAIYFDKVIKKDRDGVEIEIKQPLVDYKKCIGCGICENKCPVTGKKAIYVLPPEKIDSDNMNGYQ